MQNRNPVPKLSMAGAGAVLLDAAGHTLDDQVQQRIWALAAAIAAEASIGEAVPGMNNLLVTFDPQIVKPEQIEAKLLDLWEAGAEVGVAGREIEVPVVYGGAFGEDLTALAHHAGLSPRQVAERHAQASYRVYAIGFLPGFAYLSGLDPALAMPRRATPKPRIEAGAVIIGGAQAAIMPRTGPSGWHVIGKTDLELFDLQRDPPGLLQAGDRVRFRINGIES